MSVVIHHAGGYNIEILHMAVAKKHLFHLQTTLKTQITLTQQQSLE